MPRTPLALRLATPADAAQVRAIYGPIVAETAISFEDEVPSEPETARRIEQVLAVAPWLVLEEDGVVLGYAYATKHRDRAAYRWSVDASVYVSGGRRRGGVGRALYRSLLALLARQGFHAVHAGIALPNAPSVGLHEALGFRPVAVYPKVGFKLGAWHDVGWWQLELRERSGPPAPTLAMPELLRAPDFDRLLATGLGA